MIPKTIHYCWFGRGVMPELAQRCIESWERVLPEYEIVRWDEDSFDIDSNRYVREAYDARKFAFVSDYVRLYAMYTQGGVYMDTDVEVLRTLDPYLECKAFSGFENVHSIPTGIMASEKGFPGFGDLLEAYEGKRFILPDGSFDLTTNVEMITDYYLERGLVRNNTYQVVDGFVLYPNIVFCPYKHEVGSRWFEQSTVTIHHKNGSWLTDEAQRKRSGSFASMKESVKRTLLNILGKPTVDRILLARYRSVERGKNK